MIYFSCLKYQQGQTSNHDSYLHFFGENELVKREMTVLLRKRKLGMLAKMEKGSFSRGDFDLRWIRRASLSFRNEEEPRPTFTKRANPLKVATVLVTVESQVPAIWEWFRPEIIRLTHFFYSQFLVLSEFLPDRLFLISGQFFIFWVWELYCFFKLPCPNSEWFSPYTFCFNHFFIFPISLIIRVSFLRMISNSRSSPGFLLVIFYHPDLEFMLLFEIFIS